MRFGCGACRPSVKRIIDDKGMTEHSVIVVPRKIGEPERDRQKTCCLRRKVEPGIVRPAHDHGDLHQRLENLWMLPQILMLRKLHLKVKEEKEMLKN